MSDGNNRPNTRGKAFATRKAIMDSLKQSGPQDSKTLAQQLGITAMAVRQHLYSLQDEKLITYKEVARPKGRPAKLWELTTAANRFYPDGNSELLVDMLGLINNVLGTDALTTLIKQRTEQQFAAYQQQLATAQTLQDKLNTIAAIRTNEGYMAEVKAKEGGAFWLIENHCPICVAAQSCQQFCSSEQLLFKRLLQDEATVNRIEHILDGERRCVYEVVPREAVQA